MSHPRVVVTGIGAVHGLGLDVASMLDALAAGDEVLQPGDVVRCDHFDPEQFRESPKTYMDRCADLLMGACYLAVRDLQPDWQGIEALGLQPERCGVSVGTAYGPTESMLNMTGRVQQKGLRFGSPMIFTHTFANAPGALVAIEYRLQGSCMTQLLGGRSAAAALAYALTTIRLGRADLVLAAGVDAISRPLLAALDAADAT
ncbi:MAG TPA: beta-ketoacyl synthase N-terminal-like domain-containing protein, partial [Armatimonadota bacterium]|nr:beta-ketoacyl synthase N-terminal-like domain-containing protein [Armatimonadota bacterium]